MRHENGEKRQENRDHDHMRAIGSADNRKRVKQDGDVTWLEAMRRRHLRTSRGIKTFGDCQGAIGEASFMIWTGNVYHN